MGRNELPAMYVPTGSKVPGIFGHEKPAAAGTRRLKHITDFAAGGSRRVSSVQYGEVVYIPSHDAGRTRAGHGDELWEDLAASSHKRIEPQPNLCWVGAK